MGGLETGSEDTDALPAVIRDVNPCEYYVVAGPDDLHSVEGRVGDIHVLYDGRAVDDLEGGRLEGVVVRMAGAHYLHMAENGGVWKA